MSLLSKRKIDIEDPIGGFGELKVAEITPSVEIIFTYNFNTITLETRNNNGGTNTVSGGQLTASTSASANTRAGFVSRLSVRYNPGQGTLCRFTGVYTQGVAGNTQYIGIGDLFEGFFFGYSGATFGVLHRYGGVPEIRTLTITTKSTTAEDITITLDGVAVTDVTVSDATATDTTTTANEIASYDYSDVGDVGWSARVVGSTVIFISRGAVGSGSYSLSGSSTAVGTFAQTVAQVLPTEEFVGQTSWNHDKADGTGEIQELIDFTKGNVYQIEFQYLGYGQIIFSMENPVDGRFKKVHTINYPNNNTRPSLNIPTRPLSLITTNTTNTTDISLSSASMMGGSVGTNIPTGIRRGYSFSKASIDTTEVPVFTIYNSDVYSSNINRALIDLLLISVSNDHTKAMRISFYLNATLTGSSFVDIETNLSPIKRDTSATAFSGGRLLFTVELASNSNQVLNLAGNQYVIAPGDEITITAKTVSGIGAICSASLHWIELQ